MTNDIAISLSQSSGIPVEQIEELLAKGVRPESLRGSEFPEFIPGKQYLFDVAEATNKTVSKGKTQGLEQAELTAYAVDGDGVVNKKARAKMWLAYPFDTNTFIWSEQNKGSQRQGIASQQLQAVVIGAEPSKYVPYTVQAGVGGKKHYFSPDGVELIGKEISAARDRAAILVQIGMSDAQKNPSTLKSSRFYAEWTVETAPDGQVYKKFTNFSQFAKADKLVTDASKMMARPGQDDDNLAF